VRCAKQLSLIFIYLFITFSYFIHHATRTTTWQDPRLQPQYQQQFQQYGYQQQPQQQQQQQQQQKHEEIALKVFEVNKYIFMTRMTKNKSEYL